MGKYILKLAFIYILRLCINCTGTRQIQHDFKLNWFFAIYTMPGQNLNVYQYHCNLLFWFASFSIISCQLYIAKNQSRVKGDTKQYHFLYYAIFVLNLLEFHIHRLHDALSHLVHLMPVRVRCSFCAVSNSKLCWYSLDKRPKRKALWSLYAHISPVQN